MIKKEASPATLNIGRVITTSGIFKNTSGKGRFCYRNLRPAGLWLIDPISWRRIKQISNNPISASYPEYWQWNVMETNGSNLDQESGKIRFWSGQIDADGDVKGIDVGDMHIISASQYAYHFTMITIRFIFSAVNYVWRCVCCIEDCLAVAFDLLCIVYHVISHLYIVSCIWSYIYIYMYIFRICLRLTVCLLLRGYPALLRPVHILSILSNNLSLTSIYSHVALYNQLLSWVLGCRKFIFCLLLCIYLFYKIKT